MLSCQVGDREGEHVLVGGTKVPAVLGGDPAALTGMVAF
jgi:hypothetical protein